MPSVSRFIERLGEPPSDADWQAALLAGHPEKERMFLHALHETGNHGLPARFLWNDTEAVFRSRTSRPQAIRSINHRFIQRKLDLRLLPHVLPLNTPWTERLVRLYKVRPRTGPAG